jgi:copper chaperone
MKTYRFKTNIHCSNCVRSVSAFLNDSKIQHWEVDTHHPDKILTVNTEILSADEVKALVEEAGFDAQALQND